MARWLLMSVVLLSGLAAVEAPAAAPSSSSSSSSSSASAAAVRPPAFPSAYRLGAGDLVRVEVYDNPDLTTQFRVLAQGQVSIPLIGMLAPLPGTTVKELESVITQRLADGFLRKPQVSVVVVEYAFAGVYVVGAVQRPGIVRLVPGQELTLAQALGEAGGFADGANREVLRLVRAGPGQESLVCRGIEDQQAAMLGPGDQVIVSRADRVFVLGKVVRPGALELPAQVPMTVSKAISLVGGFDRFARDSAVQLLRADQPPVQIDVDGVLRGHREANDPRLQPGDTIFVPESRF